MPGSITALVTTALTSVGVGAETAGLLSPLISGAGIGAITDPSNPLKGAIGGGITGGFIGDLAGPLASATGLGQGAADVLAGGVGGALGSAVTGQNPATGAVGGALTGGVSALTSGAPFTSSGGPSAAATAAPAAAAGSPADLTSAGTTSPPSTLQQLGLSPTGAGGGNINASGTGPLATTPSIGGSVGGATPSAFEALTPGSLSGPLPSLATIQAAVPNLNAGGGGDAGILSDLGLSKRDIIPALGLAATAFKGTPGDVKQLRNMATGFANQSAELQSYINTGKLPPGLQGAVDLATKDAIAGIRSSYGNLGLSGSTMEAQAIADAKERSSAQAGQFMLSLLQSGVQEGGLSAELFNAVLQANTASDTALAQAIAGFAGAGSGGNLPQNFRVTG